MAKSIADVNFEKELAATYLKGGVTQADLAKNTAWPRGRFQGWSKTECLTF